MTAIGMLVVNLFIRSANIYAKGALIDHRLPDSPTPPGTK